MLFTSITQDYFRWHYGSAFSELFHLWLNFLWFTVHFFSIPQLTRSLFAPFKRMTESRGNNWSFEDLAGFIIINLLSRLIGAMLRTIIILIGLLAVLVLISLGVLTYLFWIFAPAILLVLMGGGIALFVTNLMW